jgi:hypothetical protein
MQAVKTIGLDIAKSGFQVHGVGANGQVVFRRLMTPSGRCDQLNGFDPTSVLSTGMRS